MAGIIDNFMKNSPIKYKLKNGLKVVLVPEKAARSVSVVVGVKTGSKNENKKNNGISHFLEHMFFKGTKKRPTAEAISKVIDSVGGEHNAFTNKEMTGYWVKVDSRHMALGVDIIADILLNSKFVTSAIEREKGVVVEEINMYEDMPIYQVGNLFEKLLYKNQPAGRSIIGTKKSVLSLKRSDLMAYIKQGYSAENIILCIAGNFQLNKCQELVRRNFNKVRAGEASKKPEVIEKQNAPEVSVQFKDTDQAHLWLGVRTCNYRHKDSEATHMLATILGGYASSRIFSSLREKAGLAYYVSTFTRLNPDTGYLATRAGVPTNKVKEAIKIILRDYKKARSDITAAELKRARENFFGRTLLGLESSDNLADHYLEQEILEGKSLSPKQIFKKYEKVSVADVKRVAREVFVDAKLNLTVIGPYKDQGVFKKYFRV